jgi:hypothetical protein
MASYLENKPETRLFIGGEFVEPKSGKTFDIYNPATEELAATVYEAGAEEVDAAVEAAKAAFDGWEGLGALGRTGILLKLADSIEANAEELDYLDAICMGKPISDCNHFVSVRMNSRLTRRQFVMPGSPPSVFATMPTNPWTYRAQAH